MKKTFILPLLLLFFLNSIFSQTEEYTKNQSKYAEILGVTPYKLSNTKLYNFIDKEIGKPYLHENKIHSPSFTQKLFKTSYNIEIEYTAQKQFDSDLTELFKDKEYLMEGDLIFFGKDPFSISHVGVYLHNNKFIHYTSSKIESPSGVKISDITSEFWDHLFFSCGRKSLNVNYSESSKKEPSEVWCGTEINMMKNIKKRHKDKKEPEEGIKNK